MGGGRVRLHVGVAREIVLMRQVLKLGVVECRGILLWC